MKFMKMFITSAGTFIGTKNEDSLNIIDVARTDILIDKYGNASINCILLGNCDVESFENCIAIIELSSDSPYFKSYKNMLDNIK